MSLTEPEIRTIVDRITAELDRGRAERPSARATAPPPAREPSPRASLGIFQTVDEAVAAARAAQREIRTLQLRDRIIANQRKRLGEAAASSPRKRSPRPASAT